MPKQAKDFVFAGKEVFNLDQGKKSAKKADQAIVLNIDEDDVVLSEKGKKFLERNPSIVIESSGFFLIDWYRKLNQYFALHSKIKSEEKANFFHLLAVMVNAGVPVIKSLKSLIGQLTPGSHLCIVVEDLLHRVEAGESLSEAMSAHGDEFSEMEVGMIESGEDAGQLNKTLENLASDIATRDDIKHKVKSALMYPVAIIFLLIAVMVVMMVFVIPKMSDLFSRSGEDLPLVTKIVVGSSNFLIDYGYFLLAGLIILFILIKLGKKTEGGKYIWDKLKINIPVFGKLFKMTYLSRFARSISNLMGSGVPIVKTLDITSTAVGNEVYKRRIFLSTEDIKQGIPLAENLSDHKLFPPMLVNMVEVGEKTAQLDAIMAKVADYYEEDVATTVQGISKIIEPIILILIGVSVGVIVAAIMLPIMQLSNIAGNL